MRIDSKNIDTIADRAQSLIERCQGFIVSSHILVDDAKIVVSLAIVAVDRHCLLQLFFGRGVIACFFVQIR